MENKIKDFTDLQAWKESHAFVIDIYNITKSFPKEERYGLISQLRRSASSISANIAEGFSRYSYRDKNRFYYNSRGSLSECQNHILIARDIGYLSEAQTSKLLIKSDKARKILNGLIRSTEKQIKK